MATPDDAGTWGGLFPGSFVLANFGHILGSDLRRVSFWGHDDTGVYREVAPEHFDSWLRWLNGLVLVTQRDLLSMGFRYD